MFQVWRLMADNSYKVVGRYLTEEPARRRLAFLEELHPDRRYGFTWPENFLNTTTSIQSVNN